MNKIVSAVGELIAKYPTYYTNHFINVLVDPTLKNFNELDSAIDAWLIESKQEHPVADRIMDNENHILTGYTWK